MRDAAADQSLLASVELARMDPTIWDVLNVDVQTKIRIFIENLPPKMLDELEWMCEVPTFKQATDNRIRAMSTKERIDTLYFETPAPILQLTVDRYIHAPSFDYANTWGKVVQRDAADFSQQQVIQIITGASKNNQVLGSFELGPVLASLRKVERVPEVEFDKLLRESNLEKYITDDDIPF
jgi:hypothetical protein